MYKVISLFSGSGGLDLGFLQTKRFEVVMANDFNQFACQTYRNNIGDHIICDDIKNVKGQKVDVIIGGPPCQGFSTANPNRAFDDPRNWLFKEYSRIIQESNPKIFLMENVSGMLTLDGGKVYKAIKEEFERIGYRTVDSILNTVDFEVPQKRRRLIMVGVRKDIDAKYTLPTPILQPPLFGQYRTVGDALMDKLDNEKDPNDNPANISQLNAERLKYIPQGGAMKDVPKSLRNNSDPKRSMRRLHMMMPSHTIVHNNCDHYYHPTEERRITIREMALIQTYPADYIFYGSKSEQSRQVGNSVPVRFAFHLGTSIAGFLDGLK
jgi:DNA (cytosine-5)-methyltransferase 1